MRNFSAALHGWLLLLPAMALLMLFTHWPALATVIDSFYTTPRPRRPAAFAGWENYRQILDDPIFWQALTNNLWFAIGTIPISVALAMLMAVWVNDRIAGRTLVRMAYFTPTVLPMIAVANIWLFFYTPQYGLLAQLFGVFGATTQNWNISGGTLVGDTNSIKSNKVTISNNALLNFTQSIRGTFAGAIIGTGSLTKDGAGTVTLANPNSYQGSTTVLAGTLALSGAGTLGHGNGTARFEIEPDGENASKLIYKGTGEIGGLAAGVGQRILASVSKHLIGRFFVALRKEFEQPISGAAG